MVRAEITTTFSQYWDFIAKRGVSTIQERSELEYLFNLMQGCESYLEIGSAEGNSMLWAASLSTALRLASA